MSKYLYLVRINEGRSNPDHNKFHENVMNLNAKSPDFGGINNACVISHHMDVKTIHMLCSRGMSNKSDVEVEELTKESLNDKNSFHKLFKQLIESAFLPYGEYPNVE